MPQYCQSCAKPIQAGVTVCPSCQTAVAQPVGATTDGATSGGLPDNVAAMLAYVTIIPAIVFLFLAPYSAKPFVRYHSFQSIFFGLAWIALSVVLGVVGTIPVLGWMTLLLWPIVGLAGLAIWFVLMLKAYQGQRFRLPVIGDLAEKQSQSSVAAAA